MPDAMTGAPARQPDFKIFTTALKALEQDDGGRTLVATGSSDIVDYGGDRMEVSALRDMESGIPGKTIFMNHSYNVPDDVFGRCVGAKIVQRDGRADLDLTIAVAGTNAGAEKTWNLIKQDAVQLGVSVGCFIDDFDLVERNKQTGEPGYVSIRHVTPLEFSIVGIPANPRSWVQMAAKALRQRGMATKCACGCTCASGAPDPACTCDCAECAAIRDQAATAKRAKRKAEDDDAKAAQEARSKQYGIGIKAGGNVTKPAEFAEVPDELYGDPVNYRYPMPDKDHADDAASRWGDASNRSEYTDAEQKIIGDRITRAQASHGENKETEKKMPAKLTVKHLRAVMRKRAEEMHEDVAGWLDHHCVHDGDEDEPGEDGAEAMGAEEKALLGFAKKHLSEGKRDNAAMAHDGLARLLGLDCDDAYDADEDAAEEGESGEAADREGNKAATAALLKTLEVVAKTMKRTEEQIAALAAVTGDAKGQNAALVKRQSALQADLNTMQEQVKALGETSVGRPTLRLWRENGEIDSGALISTPTAEIMAALSE